MLINVLIKSGGGGSVVEEAMVEEAIEFMTFSCVTGPHNMSLGYY